MTIKENKSVMTIPHDFEAEQAVLGAIITENSLLNDIIGILNISDFHTEGHKHIYRAVLELEAISSPIDEILLGDKLNEYGKLEEIGGYAYLAELTDCSPVAGNIVFYARIIQEDGLLRDLITTAADISRKGRDPEQSIAELLNEADEKLFQIRNKAVKKDYVVMKDACIRTFDRLEEISKNKSEITGIPTGYMDLDRITSGLQPSDLIIIAARPSMGKTALSLNIGTYVATRSDFRGAVLIFSMEMSTEQVTVRMLTSESRVDSKKFRSGNFDHDDWDGLAGATDRLSVAPIYINDDPLSIAEVRAISKKLNREFQHGVSIIVIDYLQLMKGGSKAGNREQEISEISRGAKQLAKELKVPVIALSQLNRQLENRTDKRPRLSDLRESGSIEQDADLILFIYRDEIYNPDTDKKGTAEIIIGKHRNGPLGMIELAFSGKYTKFASLSKLEPPQRP